MTQSALSSHRRCITFQSFKASLQCMNWNTEISIGSVVESTVWPRGYLRWPRRVSLPVSISSRCTSSGTHMVSWLGWLQLTPQTSTSPSKYFFLNFRSKNCCIFFMKIGSKWLKNNLTSYVKVGSNDLTSIWFLWLWKCNEMRGNERWKWNEDHTVDVFPRSEMGFETAFQFSSAGPSCPSEVCCPQNRRCDMSTWSLPAPCNWPYPLVEFQTEVHHPSLSPGKLQSHNHAVT